MGGNGVKTDADIVLDDGMIVNGDDARVAFENENIGFVVLDAVDTVVEDGITDRDEEDVVAFENEDIGFVVLVDVVTVVEDGIKIDTIGDMIFCTRLSSRDAPVTSVDRTAIPMRRYARLFVKFTP